MVSRPEPQSDPCPREPAPPIETDLPLRTRSNPCRKRRSRGARPLRDVDNIVIYYPVVDGAGPCPGDALMTQWNSSPTPTRSGWPDPRKPGKLEPIH